ncbi:MAG TPA: response regulator, partial [Thermoanaerobaculia bacterium]
EVLFVWPDEAEHDALRSLLEHEGVRVRFVRDGSEALGALDEAGFDCVILGIPARGGAPRDVLGEIARQSAGREIPVVVFAPSLLDSDREAEVQGLARTAGTHEARSLEKLLDRATLALHQPLERLPDEKRATLQGIYSTDRVLAGKRVLIVDDDIRNIFALTSVLERQSMDVLSAETGKDAIEKLQKEHDVDIVLMDIMMPDMDGYDTMRAIRKMDRFRDLPIIAVTSKAMKGDREKTLQAGAWDYLSKPVDTEQMLSVLRNWLFR